MSTGEPKPFDPLRILAELERHRVAHVVIGALAGVLHGTDEITDGVDICPQMKDANLERLQQALEDLGGHEGRRKELVLDQERVAGTPVTVVATDAGEVKIIPQPAGTNGYSDLRRGASREPLGEGVRASVASVDDLARMMTSLGRREDESRLAGAPPTRGVRPRYRTRAIARLTGLLPKAPTNAGSSYMRSTGKS